MKPTTETQRHGGKLIHFPESKFVTGFNAGLEAAARHLLREGFDNAHVYVVAIRSLKIKKTRAKSQKPKAGVL